MHSSSRGQSLNQNTNGHKQVKSSKKLHTQPKTSPNTALILNPQPPYQSIIPSLPPYHISRRTWFWSKKTKDTNSGENAKKKKEAVDYSKMDPWLQQQIRNQEVEIMQASQVEIMERHAKLVQEEYTVKLDANKSTLEQLKKRSEEVQKHRSKLHSRQDVWDILSLKRGLVVNNDVFKLDPEIIGRYQTGGGKTDALHTNKKGDLGYGAPPRSNKSKTTIDDDIDQFVRYIPEKDSYNPLLHPDISPEQLAYRSDKQLEYYFNDVPQDDTNPENPHNSHAQSLDPYMLNEQTTINQHKSSGKTRKDVRVSLLEEQHEFAGEVPFSEQNIPLVYRAGSKEQIHFEKEFETKLFLFEESKSEYQTLFSTSHPTLDTLISLSDCLTNFHTRDGNLQKPAAAGKKDEKTVSQKLQDKISAEKINSSKKGFNDQRPVDPNERYLAEFRVDNIHQNTQDTKIKVLLALHKHLFSLHNQQGELKSYFLQKQSKFLYNFQSGLTSQEDELQLQHHVKKLQLVHDITHFTQNHSYIVQNIVNAALTTTNVKIIYLSINYLHELLTTPHVNLFQTELITAKSTTNQRHLYNKFQTLIHGQRASIISSANPTNLNSLAAMNDQPLVNYKHQSIEQLYLGSNSGPMSPRFLQDGFTLALDNTNEFTTMLEYVDRQGVQDLFDGIIHLASHFLSIYQVGLKPQKENNSDIDPSPIIPKRRFRKVLDSIDLLNDDESNKKNLEFRAEQFKEELAELERQYYDESLRQGTGKEEIEESILELRHKFIQQKEKDVVKMEKDRNEDKRRMIEAKYTCIDEDLMYDDDPFNQRDPYLLVERSLEQILFIHHGLVSVLRLVSQFASSNDIFYRTVTRYPQIPTLFKDIVNANDDLNNIFLGLEHRVVNRLIPTPTVEHQKILDDPKNPAFNATQNYYAHLRKRYLQLSQSFMDTKSNWETQSDLKQHLSWTLLTLTYQPVADLPSVYYAAQLHNAGFMVLQRSYTDFVEVNDLLSQLTAQKLQRKSSAGDTIGDDEANTILVEKYEAMQNNQIQTMMLAVTSFINIYQWLDKYESLTTNPMSILVHFKEIPNIIDILNELIEDNASFDNSLTYLQFFHTLSTINNNSKYIFDTSLQASVSRVMGKTDPTNKKINVDKNVITTGKHLGFIDIPRLLDNDKLLHFDIRTLSPLQGIVPIKYSQQQDDYNDTGLPLSTEVTTGQYRDKYLELLFHITANTFRNPTTSPLEKFRILFHQRKKKTSFTQLSNFALSMDQTDGIESESATSSTNGPPNSSLIPYSSRDVHDINSIAVLNRKYFNRILLTICDHLSSNRSISPRLRKMLNTITTQPSFTSLSSLPTQSNSLSKPPIFSSKAYQNEQAYLSTNQSTPSIQQTSHQLHNELQVVSLLDHLCEQLAIEYHIQRELHFLPSTELQAQLNRSLMPHLKLSHFHDLYYFLLSNINPTQHIDSTPQSAQSFLQKKNHKNFLPIQKRLGTNLSLNSSHDLITKQQYWSNIQHYTPLAFQLDPVLTTFMFQSGQFPLFSHLFRLVQLESGTILWNETMNILPSVLQTVEQVTTYKLAKMIHQTAAKNKIVATQLLAQLIHSEDIAIQQRISDRISKNGEIKNIFEDQRNFIDDVDLFTNIDFSTVKQYLAYFNPESTEDSVDNGSQSNTNASADHPSHSRNKVLSQQSKSSSTLNPQTQAKRELAQEYDLLLESLETSIYSVESNSVFPPVDYASTHTSLYPQPNKNIVSTDRYNTINSVYSITKKIHSICLAAVHHAAQSNNNRDAWEHVFDRDRLGLDLTNRLVGYAHSDQVFAAKLSSDYKKRRLSTLTPEQAKQPGARLEDIVDFDQIPQVGKEEIKNILMPLLCDAYDTTLINKMFYLIDGIDYFKTHKDVTIFDEIDDISSIPSTSSSTHSVRSLDDILKNWDEVHQTWGSNVTPNTFLLEKTSVVKQLLNIVEQESLMMIMQDRITQQAAGTTNTTELRLYKDTIPYMMLQETRYALLELQSLSYFKSQVINSPESVITDTTSTQTQPQPQHPKKVTNNPIFRRFHYEQHFVMPFLHRIQNQERRHLYSDYRDGIQDLRNDPTNIQNHISGERTAKTPARNLGPFLEKEPFSLRQTRKHREQELYQTSSGEDDEVDPDHLVIRNERRNMRDIRRKERLMMEHERFATVPAYSQTDTSGERKRRFMNNPQTNDILERSENSNDGDGILSIISLATPYEQYNMLENGQFVVNQDYIPISTHDLYQEQQHVQLNRIARARDAKTDQFITSEADKAKLKIIEADNNPIDPHNTLPESFIDPTTFKLSKKISVDGDDDINIVLDTKNKAYGEKIYDLRNISRVSKLFNTDGDNTTPVINNNFLSQSPRSNFLTSHVDLSHTQHTADQLLYYYQSINQQQWYHFTQIDSLLPQMGNDSNNMDPNDPSNAGNQQFATFLNKDNTKPLDTQRIIPGGGIVIPPSSLSMEVPVTAMTPATYQNVKKKQAQDEIRNAALLSPTSKITRDLWGNETRNQNQYQGQYISQPDSVEYNQQLQRLPIYIDSYGDDYQILDDIPPLFPTTKILGLQTTLRHNFPTEGENVNVTITSDYFDSNHQKYQKRTFATPSSNDLKSSSNFSNNSLASKRSQSQESSTSGGTMFGSKPWTQVDPLSVLHPPPPPTLPVDSLVQPSPITEITIPTSQTVSNSAPPEPESTAPAESSSQSQSNYDVIHPTYENISPLSFSDVVHPTTTTISFQTNPTLPMPHTTTSGSTSTGSNSLGGTATIVPSIQHSTESLQPTFAFTSDDPLIKHPFDIPDQNPFMTKQPSTHTLTPAPQAAKPLIKPVESKPSKLGKRFY